MSWQEIRVRALNEAPRRNAGDFVLYWMTAFRRPRYNYSLDRAIDHARELDKPLVVLEALRLGYRWASDRIHRFVTQGMADNLDAFEGASLTYYPYVEPSAGAGSGLLESLSKRASVVVTDDFPCFFLPRMAASAAETLSHLGVALEAVDGNGLYPMYDTDRVFSRAFDFRRHLQKRLPEFLDVFPRAEPLRHLELPSYRLPAAITKKWPRASAKLLRDGVGLHELAIDHSVSIAPDAGGERAGRKRLGEFMSRRFENYEERNHPEKDAASGLSPYLHFGHVSAHEIFARVVRAESWSPASLSRSTSGKREGWWGMSAHAEAFLDELVTWREVGFNMCAHRADYDEYDSLPGWAQETLSVHADDERPYLYSHEQLERAETHDDIWNAAQRQIVREGRMHNYLRMLWGKKILEWSESPRAALEVMTELNNKYGLDGRNPNSYSGIFWVLGRYDRAWGPERPIFGKVRYMSSENTKRKLRLGDYLTIYGEGESGR